MEKIKQAIYTALRDDSTATVGLRTLLGSHTATPYGVYFGRSPVTADYSSKSYLTYSFLSGDGDMGSSDSSCERRSGIFQITAWSESNTTMERILRRVSNVLHRKNKVTNPTSESQLVDIQLASQGPDLFDDDAKVYYRSDQYRVWWRDDITD